MSNLEKKKKGEHALWCAYFFLTIRIPAPNIPNFVLFFFLPLFSL